MRLFLGYTGQTKQFSNVNANEHKKSQLIRRNDTNEQHVKDAYDRKEINSEPKLTCIQEGCIT